MGVLLTSTLVDGAGGATAAAGALATVVEVEALDPVGDPATENVSDDGMAAPVPDAAGPVMAPFAVEMPEFC